MSSVVNVLCCSFVEPPVAANLELCKLAHLDPHYAPSRNRQWHTYSVKQQEGRRSQTRIYLRGVIRQVGGFLLVTRVSICICCNLVES